MVSVGELSVAGGAIYVAIRTIEWSIGAVRDRKNGNSKDKGRGLVDLDRERIKDIHDYTEVNKEAMLSVRQGVASGGFACVWQGRDEVRNFFDAIKVTSAAIKENTRELKQLTAEMRKANNGR